MPIFTYRYFKKKIFWPYIVVSYTILGPKTPFSQEMATNNENIFFDLILEFFPQFNSVWSMSKFQNHWTLACLCSISIAGQLAKGREEMRQEELKCSRGTG
jgi:hypothetical protein